MAFFTATTAIIAGVGLAAVGLSQQEDAEDAAHAAQMQQVQASRDAAQAQREQFNLQKKQADIENQRRVRATVRQARLARAALVNQGANTGTGGSSGVIGGVASIGAQEGSELGFFGQMKGLNENIITTQIAQATAAERAGVAQGRLAGAQAKSQAAGSLVNLGSTIFEAGGGFKSIFGKKS